MTEFKNHHTVRETRVEARVFDVGTVMRHGTRVHPERIVVTYTQHNDEKYSVHVVVAEEDDYTPTRPEWAVWHDEELSRAPEWVREFTALHLPHDTRQHGLEYLDQTRQLLGRLHDSGYG